MKLDDCGLCDVKRYFQECDIDLFMELYVVFIMISIGLGILIGNLNVHIWWIGIGPPLFLIVVMPFCFLMFDMLILLCHTQTKKLKKSSVYCKLCEDAIKEVNEFSDIDEK